MDCRRGCLIPGASPALSAWVLAVLVSLRTEAYHEPPSGDFGVSTTPGSEGPRPQNPTEPPPEESDDAAGLRDVVPIDRQLGPYARPPPQGERVETTQGRNTNLWPWKGHYYHNGFYFRFAGGPGFALNKLDGGEYVFAGAPDDPGRMTGIAFETELSLGGTPLASLAVGAGLYTSLIPAGTAKAEADTPNYDFLPSQLALLAPFGDWYIKPRLGLHVQGAAGVAFFNQGFGHTGEDGAPKVPGHVAIGGGFMVGVGYEWWIHPHWGLGVLLRTLRSWTAGADLRHRTGTFALLATATFH